MKAVNGICKRCHRLRHCGQTGHCGVCFEILREEEKRRPSSLGANVMDAPGGPVCGCGRPSTHESGWCGKECEAKFGNTVLVVREVACELCIDPIDKPYVDPETGAKSWRACPDPATRQVLDEKGRTLNVCEAHYLSKGRAPIECECTGWTMVGYPGSAYDPSWLEGLDEVYGHHPSCEKYKAP